MTAKGRSSTLSPNGDNYSTPAWPIRRFCEEWEGFATAGYRWFEPCAGEGAIVRVIDEERAKRGLPPAHWDLVELRDTRDELLALRDAAIVAGRSAPWAIHSPVGFVGKRIVREKVGGKVRSRVVEDPSMPLWEEPQRVAGRKLFDVGIMNPPFSLTMDFLLRMLELCEIVIMLQRQNFPGSEDRNEWIRDNHPSLYMLPDRVDFSGDGKADAIGHGWYVWEETGEAADPFGLFRVLKCTPLAERKADRPRLGLRRPMPAAEPKPRRRR